MCFAPQRRALFPHRNFQEWSVRTWCILYILTSKYASGHNGVHFFDISTAKSGPDLVCFAHFDFEMCFAPQRRGPFSTSQIPKVVRKWRFAHFDLEMGFAPQRRATSKSDPNPSIFNTLYFQMCFAPQGCALFQHLNFLKWSEPLNFYTFYFQMCFAPQRRATFHLSSPRYLRTRRFSEPTFQPSGATKPRKNTMFRDFPIFSRTCIFFLLIFSLLTLLPANCFFISPYCRKFDF